MDTNHILFLVGLLVLVISFGVILNINPPRERFESEQPLVSLNSCGRQLVFPNFSSTNLASQRAANETDLIQGISKGSCNIPFNNEGADKGGDTYSVIKDNYIFYSLKRTCLGLSYKSIEVLSTTRVAITFNTDNESDSKAVMFFMLLNPMFVEFNFNANATTVAYYPVFHNNIEELGVSNPMAADKEYVYSSYDKDLSTQYGGGSKKTNAIRVVFDVVLPKEGPSRDALFNYYTTNTPFTYLSEMNYQPSGVISVQIYYLDDNIPTSYQNVGEDSQPPTRWQSF